MNRKGYFNATEKEIEREFEKNTGIPVSFHWENSGGGGKRGVLVKKNIETLNKLEKALGPGEKVNFEIKDKYGKLTEVSKEEFAWWMVNEKNKDSWRGGVFSSANVENLERKLVEANKDQFTDEVVSEKKLVHRAKENTEDKEYFVGKKTGNEVIRESYYQPRSEEEEKQIIERNKKRRSEAKENSQPKNLESKQPEEINLSNPTTQKKDKHSSSDNNLKTKSLTWGGIGAVGLLGVAAVVIKVIVTKEKSF